MFGTVHIGPVKITLDSGVEEQQQNAHVSPAKKTNAPARVRLDALQLSRKWRIIWSRVRLR